MTKDEIYTDVLTGIEPESQHDHERRQALGKVYDALRELAKRGHHYELAPLSQSRPVDEWPKWIDGKVYDSQRDWDERDSKAGSDGSTAGSTAALAIGGKSPSDPKPVVKSAPEPLAPVISK